MQIHRPFPLLLVLTAALVAATWPAAQARMIPARQLPAPLLVQAATPPMEIRPKGAVPLGPSTLVAARPPAPGPAPAAAVVAAVRAGAGGAAPAAAAADPGPVAAKLVTYYRLLSPGAGSLDEINRFMTDNPDWPAQETLARRRDEALASEPDDPTALAACVANPPRLPGAALRCAGAYAQAGQAGKAAEAARQAWIGGLTEPAAEAAFLRQWEPMITSADQWLRFDRLDWDNELAAAARQVARLPSGQRKLAEARLALRHDDPKSAALIAALPTDQRRDPALVLDQARALRRAGQDEAEQALFRAAGAAAERAAPEPRRPQFWTERNLLARRLLREGDAEGAYAVAAGHAQTAAEPAAEAEFLAGFIALRRLHQPARAARHFTTLAELSRAAITQGRALYWLGRAHAAAGADARPDYARAAAYVTTFYGQLAALALDPDPAALNARIAALHDPGWDRDRVLGFAEREVTRAAAFLIAWGEPRRAHAFILRLDELAPDPTDRSLAARLALGLGVPDQAVAVARRAGRDGVMLAESGWPVAITAPGGPVEPALTLGIVRQESSFDVQAVSPSGARGLMQLMPATATQVGRQIGTPVALAALTSEPELNIHLGTSYLQMMLDQFQGSVPLAVAAYNAGPGRVEQWLAENGDPRGAGPAAARPGVAGTAAPGDGGNAGPAAPDGASQAGASQTGASQAAVAPAATSEARVASAVPAPPEMIDWIELIGFNETRNYVQRVIEGMMIYRARQGAVLPHPALPGAH